MSLTVSDLDLRTVAALLATDGEPLPLEGRVNASLDFDPADPVSAVGSLEISGIAVAVEDDAPLELGQTIHIEMREGRIVLPPTHLRPQGGMIGGNVPLDLEGIVELSRDWRPGDDPASLVESVLLELDGSVDARLLNPFLAGGVANGEVLLGVSARGSLETLTADVTIQGSAARVLYRRPYPTRLEALDVKLVVRRGEVTLEHARARLNGGEAEMSGTLTGKDGLRANLRFDDARYRLEFGVTTLIRGDLRLEWPPRGRRRIEGTVVVERAVLRRDIGLTRDVLGVLLDVRPESGGTIDLNTIDLDLTVMTDQGVLLKNNVADVQADWGRLGIGGTAAEPLLDGRVDIQPGGIITAFGQALRIDEASFEWSDQPVTEPRIIFETTSSADDPNILKSWRNEFFTPADMGPGRGGTLDFWGQGQAQQAGSWEQLATGAMTQATSLNRTQLSYEPLPLFGETDSQARYTLSSDLAPQFTFIASTNPRETEAQTYILDIHRVPYFQSFRAQVFTNDQKNAGLTIQQTLKLGKRQATDTEDPVLHATAIVIPGGVKKRRIRNAIGYRKSDPFPLGAGLGVEVDVIDLMQRRGFPSAEVDVEVNPTEKNRVDLVVTIEPGAPVRFVFEGEQLPSRARKAIVSRYRPRDLGNKVALEEVQRETMTLLRGRGFLAPRVDVEAIPVEMTGPDEPAIVRVITEGGKQVELAEIVMEGVPDEDARYVDNLFSSTLSKVRLAVETPASDAMLLQALDRRGYPEARIEERTISDDGQSLSVDIDLGRRRHLTSIEIVGLDDQDRARLQEVLGVHEGDPASEDRIGSAGRSIERDLRDRGHADARVATKVQPVAEDRPFEIALRYEVDPGPSYQVAEVRFEGLKASRARWVERVAGLEAGQLFRRTDVADARARLFRTGVFRRIQTSSDTVSPEPGEADKRVTFEVEEALRWQLAYGGRWEESKGLSVVADLVNRHSFGVGHTTGIRGILGREQQNLRLYHVIPRVVGERSSLEFLVEAGRQPLTETVDVQGAEAWAQVTFQLTERVHNRPYIRFTNPTLIQNDPESTEPLDDRVVSPTLGYQVAFDSTSRRLGEERRRGVFVGIDFLGSHEALGSDVTTAAVVSQLKYFMPIGKRESGRFSWAQFWRGGLAEAKDQPVPFVDRFRVGGEFSVRGYPTNSLGPQDADGNALGGEVLFVMNQEIHAQILRTESLGSVALLGFFDAGNVWLDRESLGGGLFKSVGVGARYLSPVGPLRLDFGVPLDRRPDDPSYKIYIGFGSVF
jgi:outer membrane protein assembly factor BamA